MQLLTLRQKAYQRIREKLLAAELTAGTPLSEPDLARELGMSRTPIREAIRQMEMEGLVDYAPRFGVTVRIPDRSELAEMYTVREALESHAAAEAAQRISKADLERLGDLWQQMRQIAAAFQHSTARFLEGDGLRQFLAVDMQFHQVVIHAAGNQYMAKILDDTRLLTRVFTSTFWVYDRRSLAEANRFHERLLRALRKRDAQAAQQCTQQAMQVARRNALAAWDNHRISPQR